MRKKRKYVLNDILLTEVKTHFRSVFHELKAPLTAEIVETAEVFQTVVLYINNNYCSTTFTLRKIEEIFL